VNRRLTWLSMALCAMPILTTWAGAQAPDRSRLPASVTPPPLKLPVVQKHQLTNGLPVWIVELHDVPIAQVNLVILSGSADDPPDKYGIGRMTSAMLPNGAGSRSALDIADAIDFLGADLTTGSGADASAVRLHVPVQRLDEALAVMADVALRPTFPSDELERLRKQRLTDLIQARDDPETIAQLAFSRVVFGPSHRFGTAFMGTAATIKAFTTADLRAFYQSTYRPDNAVLMVVGDVTPAKTLPLLESKFGSWKRVDSPKTRVVHSPASPPTKRDVYLIDKPGAPQSQIRIGAIGVSRTNPDYFAIQVMNTVLGGSFSSRLNLNLREKQGFAYNASSAFDMRREPGPVFAYAGVQTDKTADALREFFNVLSAIHRPVTAEELQRAKNYIALSFPQQFETTGDITANLETLRVYDLPDDYFTKYVPAILAVTANDVQRVAEKYIQPDRVAVVVVGDLKAIEPGIRNLNLGPVHVMRAEEIIGN
jgi:predicted Zn-dependent peptidase